MWCCVRGLSDVERPLLVGNSCARSLQYTSQRTNKQHEVSLGLAIQVAAGCLGLRRVKEWNRERQPRVGKSEFEGCRKRGQQLQAHQRAVTTGSHTGSVAEAM
jgi:hypothetical protein